MGQCQLLARQLGDKHLGIFYVIFQKFNALLFLITQTFQFSYLSFYPIQLGFILPVRFSALTQELDFHVQFLLLPVLLSNFFLDEFRGTLSGIERLFQDSYLCLLVDQLCFQIL